MLNDLKLLDAWSGRRAGVALIALALLAPMAYAAPSPDPGPGPDGRAASLLAPGHCVTSSPPLARWGTDSFWSFLQTTLNNRTRMIQFSVVGMCIALYVMFRARG